jgi:hypothetical protein
MSLRHFVFLKANNLSYFFQTVTIAFFTDFSKCFWGGDSILLNSVELWPILMILAGSSCSKERISSYPFGMDSL